MKTWKDSGGSRLELGGAPMHEGDMPLTVYQDGDVAVIDLTPTMRRELAAALLEGLDGDAPTKPANARSVAFVEGYEAFISARGNDHTLNTDDLRGIWAGLRAAGVVR